MPEVTGNSTEAKISELRRLVRRLLTVGPVVPMGVVASSLGLSRMQVWRLVQEGRLKTEPIQGAKFVCLQSALKYLERQQRRQAKAQTKARKKAESLSRFSREGK